MRIGFIGLGAMGLPMAGHLVAAGHEVTVASRVGVRSTQPYLGVRPTEARHWGWPRPPT